MHNHLILIVEDHWEIREVMEQYLSREGFRTMERWVLPTFDS
ncbi:response regulator transcription factor [Sinorhizobium meliloti]|nr:response regulator transcription factor [Sinorhizobium meliloti]